MAPRPPRAADRPRDDADETLLAEIRDRFEYATNEWADIRAEAAIDMRYVAGDPWDPEERRARKAAGRPCLTQDELGQYFNQVINGVRAVPRAIQFSAKGGGASEATAKFYTNHTREIEYRSHAQVVYTTAFQDAIHRGYGFCRVTTAYESDTSFNLQIALAPLVNPDLVLPDPDAQRPDSSDMRYCFVIESRSHEEFTREFPDAQLTDFASLQVEFPQWVKEHRVLIAEYWTITTTRRRLLLIQAPPPPAPVGMGTGMGLGQPPAPPPKPVAVFEDEVDLATMPPGASIITERTVDYPSVCQYLTNGVEILKKTEWPGKYIPIASCYGMVLYVEGKRQIVSMTRLARDPYMLFCYYRTCEAELVGMTPKTPYMAYDGQFSPDQMTEVQKSLHEPVAVLFAKPTVEGLPQQLLPLPQRQPYAPEIAALEIGAESARRGIQAAMGSSPLPTSAQRRNEKSGIALQQIEDTSQRGSYHFNDHYDDMIRQVGVILEDLIAQVIDTAREVGVREPNGTATVQRVNDPTDPRAVSTQGEHDVTVSTGAAYESERAAESAFADTLMASPFAPLVADLAIKLKGGGPTLDAIAERLTPPQFAKPTDGQAASPQQLQTQLQQLQGQLQQVQQAAQQMGQALQTKQAEIASDERVTAAKLASQEKITAAELASKERIAAADRETKITVAELGAKVDRLALFLEERARIGTQIADQQHELGMTLVDHAHAREVTDRQAAAPNPVVPPPNPAVAPPNGGGA